MMNLIKGIILLAAATVVFVLVRTIFTIPDFSKCREACKPYYLERVDGRGKCVCDLTKELR